MNAALAVPNFLTRPKLGETLRFFGLLSGAEVEIALSRQVNEGGRLARTRARIARRREWLTRGTRRPESRVRRRRVRRDR